MPPNEATQAEIDAQIESARERYATLEPVEDRGRERRTTSCCISFVGTVDGEAYEGNTVDKYLYETGPGPHARRVRRRACSAPTRARSAGSSSRFRRPRRLRSSSARPLAST